MKKFISLFLCTLLTGVIACGSDSNDGTQTQAPAKAAPPPRYIAVSSVNMTMTWQEARDWCSARGGRLPLINNAESLGRHMIFETKGVVTIDGVGRVNTGPAIDDFTTSWDDAGLPGAYYWTGTEYADLPGSSWYLYDSGGLVNISNYGQGYALRAVCVP